MSSKLSSGIKKANQKGITLIEALVATAILVILAISVIRGMTITLFHSQNDFLNMCIWNATTSTLTRLKVNPSLIGQKITYSCGNYSIDTFSKIVSGTIPQQPPSSGSNQESCAIVEVSAFYKNEQKSKIQGTVCRFK